MKKSINKKNILFVKIFIQINFHLFLFLILLRAQEQEKWVHCSGEAAVQNITTEEAQILARRKARLDAIEQVCGVKLQAETLVKDFITAGDFIHSISYGHVVEEKNLKWEIENLSPENHDSPPLILYRVSMDAKVVPVNEKYDPFFKLDLKLNRIVFQSGDEVILKVQATKDCYLTVINIAANDSVYILFPNSVREDNFIRRKTKIEIPNKNDREMGLHFRVITLPGHKENTEIVKVIATKQKFAFLEEADISSGFGTIGTPKTAITKLARWLSEIPVSERAEATLMYTVQAVD